MTPGVTAADLKVGDLFIIPAWNPDKTRWVRRLDADEERENCWRLNIVDDPTVLWQREGEVIPKSMPVLVLGNVELPGW